MRILVVEDDQLIAKTIHNLLKKNYVVDVVTSIANATYMMDINEYDLSIVDIGLPDGSGIELCKNWRHEKLQLPILILTAQSATTAKIVSLESGADDHVCKPFHADELLSRIRALLRRSGHYKPHTYQVGNFTFDASSKQLKNGDSPIQLNCKEGQLFELLLRHQGSIVTRAMIVEHVWENTDDLATNTIEVHISRLRKRIIRHFEVNCIKTVRNIGYFIPYFVGRNQQLQKGGDTSNAKIDSEAPH